MCEQMLVEHCSPTLAGLKTGSLVLIRYRDSSELTADLRDINRRLRPKGLRTVPLRYRNGTALIYAYRPSRLAKDLKDAAAAGALRALGYDAGDPEGAVAQLSRRVKLSESFPHEIGFFLGYPPDDVLGFMRSGGGSCKLTGYWKVYGDVESALESFRRYRKCSEVYNSCYRLGRSIEQLTVSC
jgi:hypothetical protein